MKWYMGFVDIRGNEGKVLGWDVISWFQQSPYVHVFLIFDLPEGPIVYETSETLYLKRSLILRQAGSNLEIFEMPGDGTKAHEFCESLVGTPYSYFEFIGLGVLLLTERLANWLVWPIRWLVRKANGKENWTLLRLTFVGNPYATSVAYFCSEAALSAVKQADPNLFPNWWNYSSITPRIIMDYIVERQKTFKKVRLG